MGPMEAMGRTDPGASTRRSTDPRQTGMRRMKGGKWKRPVWLLGADTAAAEQVAEERTGAFIYNVLGLPVALGILYPFLGILLSPLLAALAMSFSSVTVISNANLLKRWRPS
jgi:Cu+-exporting ATPase